MEEIGKTPDDRHSPLWAELQEKAKDDPELARTLEIAKDVMERYSDTLKRLADS